MNAPTLALDLPFAECLGRGKVREIYALGEDLLLVATDRISAFDVVMAEGIPGKGQVLTETTAFWLDLLRDVVPNHMLSVDVDAWPEVPASYRDVLRGRSMRCRRCQPLPVEWVVRGYRTGGGRGEAEEHPSVTLKIHPLLRLHRHRDADGGALRVARLDHHLVGHPWGQLSQHNLCYICCSVAEYLAIWLGFLKITLLCVHSDVALF